MATWSPIPTTSGANWQGNQALATRKQLLSSVTGLYDDLKDFDFSTISVSTLTVPLWVSTSELYVSSIIGGGLQMSNGSLVISTGDFSLVTLSTVSFTGIDLGGVSFNFDLGLGNAIGGFLGGLGALVGGVFIGLGTGVGLGIQGITNGLFSLGNTRGDSITNINTNVFETINGTSQLQISTLGNAFPLYSSIFRSVSSISANEVPGAEILLSTFFQPGTTCVRTVSDPITPLTNNSNVNTSTIQSFGQWVPFIDPTPTGEDIYARNANFSTVSVNNDAGIQQTLLLTTTENVGPTIQSDIFTNPFSNNIQQPYNFVYPLQDLVDNQAAYVYNTTYHSSILNFISSPYAQFQSTLTSQPATYFITSTISTPALFTWAGAGIGNFAICEPDESGFRSTATFDFAATQDDLLIQWGLAVDNRNSTIGAGTAKRVEWDNDANTSNFFDIPLAQSTILRQSLQLYYTLQTSPYEARMLITNSEGQDSGLFILASTMLVGTGLTNSSAYNQPGYAYQFNGNTFINGTLEAQTIIAISSIISISTNVATVFSTTLLEADAAQILSANIISASITSLNVENLYANSIVYSNAEAPNIQTSTITFGYTGNYVSLPPNYSMQMYISGPTAYSNYQTASNQTMNLMSFSNSVVVGDELFSTLMQYQQQQISQTNIGGWASTIYANGFTSPAFAYLISNVNAGSVSFQGQSSVVTAFLNDDGTGSGTKVTVPFGSTYEFKAAGGVWTTSCNAPPGGGLKSYNNGAKIYMDFENFIISTTDTLVLNSDIIKIQGTTVFDTLETTNIVASNVVANPVSGGLETFYNKSIEVSFNSNPTSVQPLQLSFTEQSPDFVPTFGLVPPFMGSNQFTSYNVTNWNGTLWNNTTAFSLGAPGVYVGDVQTTLGSYYGAFYINNAIVASPSYALNIYTITPTGSNLLGFIPGGNYGCISTVNGTTWTLDSNAPDPQGGGGSFCNIVTATQTISQTTLTNTQNLAIQAPNISMTTGSMNLYADQIRVNSRRYGSLESAGIPSFPIGIENNVYIDSNMSFTFLPASGLWESVAQNVLYNINNTIFYDWNSWIVQIIPSRFRTNANPIYEWDVQPAVLPIGGGGFCWGFNRYILVSAPIPGGPGSGTNNWNWFMAIPKNYCTYM